MVLLVYISILFIHSNIKKCIIASTVKNSVQLKVKIFIPYMVNFSNKMLWLKQSNSFGAQYILFIDLSIKEENETKFIKIRIVKKVTTL